MMPTAENIMPMGIAIMVVTTRNVIGMVLTATENHHH